MNILGINYFFHDSSACLVRDGELVVALEEERFTRKKHAVEFPTNAVQKCMEYAGVKPSDIDHIAVSIQPTKHWAKKLVYGVTLGSKMAPFVNHELIATY